MKIFISQPMRGLTTKQVITTRNKAHEFLKSLFPDDNIEIIDNLQLNLPEGTHPLEYLGNDILKMKDANIVYFVTGWGEARGCIVEYTIANNYGIPIINEDDLKLWD